MLIDQCCLPVFVTFSLELCHQGQFLGLLWAISLLFYNLMYALEIFHVGRQENVIFRLCCILLYPYTLATAGPIMNI